jgi:hypothetical protein
VKVNATLVNFTIITLNSRRRKSSKIMMRQSRGMYHLEKRRFAM